MGDYIRVRVEFPLDAEEATEMLAVLWPTKERAGRWGRARVMAHLKDTCYGHGNQFSASDHISDADWDKAFDWADRIIQRVFKKELSDA